MVGLFVVAEPVVGVLFRHGQFTAIDAQRTAELLRILILALVPIGAVRVIVPTFYALGDTKTPVYAATASLITTLALGLALVSDWEIKGLTAAISVAALVQLLALSFSLQLTLQKKMSGHSSEKDASGAGDESIMGHGIRCLLAVSPSAALVWYGRGFHDWLVGDKLVGIGALTLMAVVAGILYFVMAKLFKVQDADLIIGMVKRRIRR